MSLNVTPLEQVQTLAPVTRVSEVRKFAILKAPAQVTWQVWQSSSFSSSSIAFSAPPPSLMSLISRKVYLVVDVTLNFAGTNTGSLPLLGVAAGIDGLRAFPLSSVISTLSATINGNQVSVQISDLISAYSRIQTPEKDVLDGEYSLTPSMPDQFQTYAEGFGTNRSPLAKYGSNPFIQSRGAWANVPFPGAAPLFATPGGGIYLPSASNVAGATTGQALFTVAEEIMLSPFQFGGPESSGFIGVSGMDLNVTFNPLSRMWSRDAVTGAAAPFLSTITSIAGVVRGARLIFDYQTPSSIQPIPKSVSYPYTQLTRFATDFSTTLAPGAMLTVIGNNIQLPSIPKRIVIWARRSNATADYTTTDTFLVLTNVSLNFLNSSGTLASCPPEQLYAIARKNGLNLSWSQWANHVGSVLPLDVGVDIGLADPSVAPSVSENSQIQVTATFVNQNPTDTIAATMYVAIELEGSATLRDSSFYPATSIITRSDVLGSKDKPQVLWEDSGSARYGGNFGDILSSLKSFAGPIRSAIEAHPVGALASSALKGALCDDAPASKSAERMERHKKRKGRGLNESLMARR